MTNGYNGLDYDGKTYCTSNYLVYLILKAKKRAVKFTGEKS